MKKVLLSILFLTLIAIPSSSFAAVKPVKKAVAKKVIAKTALKKAVIKK